jgi:hypothetical protein
MMMRYEGLDDVVRLSGTRDGSYGTGGEESKER